MDLLKFWMIKTYTITSSYKTLMPKLGWLVFFWCRVWFKHVQTQPLLSIINFLKYACLANNLYHESVAFYEWDTIRIHSTIVL